MARILLFSVFFSQLVLVGCTWTSGKDPSVLVIAVESLSFDRLNCSQQNEKSVEKSGFAVLCEEAVRFTHAYTPSTLTQAALTSVLTGDYPYEHGVWHNGSRALSAKYETVAEVAIQKGYRTAFFSGGPPVWSFSGISQGFETFFDHFRINLKQLYLPVQKNFERFLDWRSETLGSPHFSVIYLPDLSFPEIVTTSDLGETRSKTIQSQISEIDESLAELIAKMKSAKDWDRTHVIFMGVNGATSPTRADELPGVDQNSSNTEVVLMIKPAGSQRDLGLQWKIDKNVSLVDVGETIFDILGHKREKKDEKLQRVSLKQALTETVSNWDEDRMILTESSWAQWLGFGNTRYSVRIDHLLFIFDRRLRAYNTFLDHQEIAPISQLDPGVAPSLDRAVSFLTENDMEAWRLFSATLIEKWVVAKNLASHEKIRSEDRIRLRGIYEKRGWDVEVINWMAEEAVRRGAWRELARLGVKIQNSDWVYISKKARGIDPKKKPEGCLQLLHELPAKGEQVSPKECEDSTFIAFVEWLVADESNVERKELSFLRLYELDVLDKTIARKSIANSITWNVDYRRLRQMRLVDLALSLPEFSKQKSVVSRHLKL